MPLPERLSAEPEQPMAAVTKTRFAPQSNSKMQPLCDQQTVGSGESGKERRIATLGQLLTKHLARCAVLN